ATAPPWPPPAQRQTGAARRRIQDSFATRVLRAEHTHGGEKRLATPFDAIEARHEEHWLSRDLLETDPWSDDAGFAGERERDSFPRDDVDLVVTPRELRNRQAAIF